MFPEVFVSTIRVAIVWRGGTREAALEGLIANQRGTPELSSKIKFINKSSIYFAEMLNAATSSISGGCCKSLVRAHTYNSHRLVEATQCHRFLTQISSGQRLARFGIGQCRF